MPVLFLGVSVSGRPADSKSANGGSIPSTPAQKDFRSDGVAPRLGRPAEKTKLKGKLSSVFICRLSKKKFYPAVFSYMTYNELCL